MNQGRHAAWWSWLLAGGLAVVPSVSKAGGGDVVRLTIDLVDGSLVKATTKLELLPVRTPMGDLQVPLARIAMITGSGDGGGILLKMENGDEIAGEPRLERLEVEACFGVAAIPLDKVVRLNVSVELQGEVTFDAAADFSAEQNPAGAWSYGWRGQSEAEFQLYRTKANTDEQNPGMVGWTGDAGAPSVALNRGKEAVHPVGTMTFEPHQLGLHPGPGGESSVIRWTAPRPGRCRIAGAFTGLSGFHGAPVTTTDVQVDHRQCKVFGSYLNLEGQNNRAPFELTMTVAQGDVIDFAVGFGNGNYGFDSTGLDARITLSPEKN